MAKIPFKIDSLDAAPEGMADFYTQTADGYQLSIEAPEGWGVDNLAKLRGQLDESRKKEARVKGMLNAFEKEDGSLMSREDIDAMAMKLSQLEETNASLSDKTKSNEELIQMQIQQARQPLQADLNAANEKLGAYQKQILGAERQRVVNEIVSQLNPLPEWKGMLEREIERHVDISEMEDGRMAARIIDPATGSQRYSALTNADGPMTTSEFAQSKELREQYGQCLAGDGLQGAQRQPSQAPQRPTSKGRDVVVNKSDYSTQQDFFSAYKQAKVEAKQNGGDVKIGE
jgi:hypothetical protein